MSAENWMPTMSLRFVRRPDAEAERRVLQQQWWRQPGPKETTGKREWRDVPLDDEAPATGAPL